MSKRAASRWLWAARLLWLTLTLVSLVIFTRGVPVFIGALRETYGAHFGFSLQRSPANELILIPDISGQAARAGVMERDVLLAVDGVPISTADVTDLDDLVPAGEAGTAVSLQIRTGERPLRNIILIRGDHAGAWLNRFNVPMVAVMAMAVGVELLVTLGFITVAAFIVWRGGQTPVSWLSSLVLVLVFAGVGSLPVQNLYFAELNWQYGLDVWFSLMVTALLLFLFLFPSGRFVPRWTIILLPLTLLWVIAAWLWPDLYFWRLDAQPYLLILVIFLLAGVTAQLWRYHTVSSPQQRQQTKWVVWGIGVALTALLFQFATDLLLPDSPLLFDLLINPLARLTQLIIPLTFALAIFQRRLWEIDVIVNRTLVYGGLTGLITAVYALVVGGFGTLAASQSERLIGLLLVIMVIVFGFWPLRARWQTVVNRLIPLPEKPPQSMTPSRKEEEQTAIPLNGRQRWLVWLSLGLGLLLFAAIMTVTMIWSNVGFDEWYFQFTGLAFLIIGTIIILRRPANRIGRLCWLIGWLFILTLFGFFEGAALAPFRRAEPFYPYAFRLSLTLMQIIVSLIFVYLPLLLPDGHYLSKNWRRFGRGLAVLTAVPILLTFIQPGLIFDWGYGQATTIVNPFAIPWPWLARIPQLTLLYLWGIPTISSILVAVSSLYLRWHRSEGEIRQQTKWIVYFLSTFVFSFMVLELAFWLVNLLPFKEQIVATAAYTAIEAVYEKLGVVAWVGFPLVIGLAILKYRLFDDDIIINRTLVYGGLSLGIGGVYVLVVGALGMLFQSQANLLFTLLATGLIAVLFQPVRERLQRGVNRLMFGERDEPYIVLSKLGAQLQTTTTPEAMLQSVVETVVTTLKLPYVAIELADEQGRLNGATVGTAVTKTAEFPLRYQNEVVGYLVVSPRSPDETFTERERQLLADIAGQTGAMAYAVRLTAALQRSRGRLVLAREEERR
ncbi:MAG: hypothetical protein KDE51_00135, partial [Anaerolineales bacterium]|nr:hypothetical protein [Anaerolineales bacterium]